MVRFLFMYTSICSSSYFQIHLFIFFIQMFNPYGQNNQFGLNNQFGQANYGFQGQGNGFFYAGPSNGQCSTFGPGFPMVSCFFLEEYAQLISIIFYIISSLFQQISSSAEIMTKNRLLGERRVYLNNSNSKWISIGTAVPANPLNDDTFHLEILLSGNDNKHLSLGGLSGIICILIFVNFYYYYSSIYQ